MEENVKYRLRRILPLLAVTAVLAFVCGIAVGRMYPAHHYERFGERGLLLDTSTGKICVTNANPNYAPSDVPPCPR